MRVEAPAQRMTAPRRGLWCVSAEDPLLVMVAAARSRCVPPVVFPVMAHGVSPLLPTVMPMVSVTPSTGLVRGQPMELLLANGSKDITNRVRLGEKDIDSCFLQGEEGALSHSRADNGVDLSRAEVGRRAAFTRSVMMAPVLHHLDLFGVRVREGKEGGASEVAVDLRIQALIVLRRDADLHHVLLSR